MSGIYSFRRLTSVASLVLVSAAVPGVSWSGGLEVRIGPVVTFLLKGTAGDSAEVSVALDGLARIIPDWVRGTPDCSALLATPREETPTINAYTDTWVRIGMFRAECWSFLKVPLESSILPATPQDGITRAMTDALMHYLLEKSATDPLENGAVDNEWLKTFTAFPGGDLNCKTPWSCTLTLPDGKVYPEQYLYIDLILAFGNRRYLEVTEAVYGSPRFVYGVELDISEAVPKVISLNFTP